MSRLGFKSATGFTLIEVLVSMVILAIGLLGLAGMQTIALKDNQDAFFYAQASSLAYEMSDRIKANSPSTGAPPWESSTVPTAATSCTSTDNCNTTTGCNSATMAAFDYCAWKANVQNRIAPDATATVAISPVTGSAVCNGGTTKRCLTISWVRNNKLGTGADTVANTSNTFQLEIQP